MILIFIAILATSFAEGNDKSDTDSLEARLEEMCDLVLGVSGTRVMITYESEVVSAFMSYGEENKKISGIAVVCEGGNDPRVKLSLYEMIDALFDIKSNRVTVSSFN